MTSQALKACHVRGVMKRSLFILPLLLASPSCKKESTASVPKAVEVREEVVIVADPPPAPLTPPVVEVTPPVVEGDPTIIEVTPPAKTPGEHLDHALQKTGEGLQTAGEKTEHGINVAREKTEEGVQKAAEKTGDFLKRMGEKIEEAGEKAK